MSKYSKFNIVYLLQKWMDSVAGQTFMNYAYSWGAAVVILGTLFKLTHLPGANIMLFIGMGTEVFVFFISAFDRPFDKTQDGRELATDSQLAAEALAEEQGGAAEGTIIIGASVMPNVAGGQPIPAVASVSAPASVSASASAPMSATSTAPTPAPAVTPETAQAMEEATTTYVDRLNELNELLLKVGAQTERITTDSEEMENLNRTLTGIARIYEMQLKSASQQINTQDEINEQTRKMAAQIAELNSIYARMIDAMKAGQNS
ncbi:MAG: gliding motility protein GldL [Prevotella sp.]|nr:gliding motility protein GldL [Prevotella sp.]